MELLIGCGSDWSRKIAVNGKLGWDDLVTLDSNWNHKPDVVHDLEIVPYPFKDDHFDELHAYEVLEHIGKQGDWKTFFAQFSEFWRILKPGGFLAATCPSYKSIWAWGDPSHTRVITSGTLVFLDQQQYTDQVGKTPMSDFRHVFHADFQPIHVQEDDEHLSFVLQAVKPSRNSLTGGEA